MTIRTFSLLLLLWPPLLTAHQAEQESDYSQYMGIILEQKAMQYGTEPLEPEHEAFIRGIIQELGITKKIIIRKMSRLGIALYRRKNACALFDRYLFVGESFFKELSEEEKRFLIGHELAHLMRNHILIRSVVFFSLLFISGIISAALALKLQSTYRLSRTTSIITGILAFAFFNRIGNIGNMMLSRHQEKEADFISVSRLQSSQGGITFLTKASAHDPYDYSKWSTRLLASHPSPQERIQLLERITTTQGKESSL